MRTAEVARQLGVSPSWLRKLERAGRVPAAPRDSLSGQRRYTQEDLERLRAVLYPPEPAPPAGPPPPMTWITLSRAYSINGVQYGPGRVEVPAALVPALREGEDRAARSAV